MDIRTKLVFACIAVSLASMLLLAAFFYHSTAAMLRDIAAQHLEGVVSARLESIQLVRRAWREEVLLIKSRTLLREQVAQYPQTPQTVGPIVRRIIDDARRSVTIIQRIAIFDRLGHPVASSGDSEIESIPYQANTDEVLTVAGFALRPDDGMDAIVHAPLTVDGERVGHLEAIVATDSLLAINANYRGLGDTGEMYMVAELEPGELTVLNRLRTSADTGLLRVPMSEASEVMLAALSGSDALLKGTLDYRGVHVWAATRTLPDLRMGLAVKVDEDEELGRLFALRAEFIDVTLSVAALAILGGALLGTWLARPIRSLRETIDKIRGGEHEVRANVPGEDEVSFLAESFNQLMDERRDEKH